LTLQEANSLLEAATLYNLNQVYRSFAFRSTTETVEPALFVEREAGLVLAFVERAFAVELGIVLSRFPHLIDSKTNKNLPERELA
jgi:hypothetical protein